MIFRWLALAAMVGTLGISTYYRRRARRSGDVIARRREGTALKLGRALVGMPLFGSVLMYLVNPRWMSWSALPLPVWVRWTGVALGLAMVPAAWWIFSSIGRNVSETVLTKTDHALVTTGPYRWIRHPLYATGSGLFVAVGLISTSWLILGLAGLAVALIRLVVVPQEERALVARFGHAYREYATRSGGLLPRVAVWGRRPSRGDHAE